MSDTPSLISKAAYARYRGCSPAYVSKLIREGRLAAPALNAHGLIDIALADAALGQPAPQLQPLTRDREPGAPARSSSDEHGYASARADRERAAAALAELELQKRRSELVDRATVDSEVETLARYLRDRMLSLPEELADRLAQTAEPRLIRQMLIVGIESALAASIADAMTNTAGEVVDAAA